MIDVKKISNLVYSTLRETNRLAGRDVGRPFYALNEGLQAAWVQAVGSLLASDTPPEPAACHRAWQLIFLRNGWRYGERFHRRGKRHPAMRGWDEPDFDENERRAFLTMATQLTPIWKEMKHERR